MALIPGPLIAEPLIPEGMVFGYRFRLRRLIGKGGFGSVYSLSDSRLVAKVEKKSPVSSLLHEYEVYRRLSHLSCVPTFYFFGEESGYYGLVLENTGNNMEEFFRLKMVVMPSVDSNALAAVVAIEIIKALKHIHSLGIIHCDVKPANVLYGKPLNMKYRFTIIDFGGCWMEADPGHRRIVGNEYFSSMRQLGLSEDGHPSRADDLVSLGYTAVYLAKNCSMSWDAEYLEYLDKKTPDAHEKWRSTKAKASPDRICSSLPAAYHTFLHSILLLSPDALPDYDDYTKVLSSVL